LENVAHTLTALALARSGLNRSTPLATTALLAGANLPDIDLAWSMHTELSYLHFHRGWTHAFSGVAVGSLVLWALLLAVDRFRRARSPAVAPARPLPLLLACWIGIGSHFLLDLMNAYGVRPFLPWSEDWFYGDLWYIVDPWLWLMLGGAVYLAGRGGKLRSGLWAFSALSITALMIALPATLIPSGARAVWISGIALAVLLARLQADGARARAVCRAALAGVVVYAVLCAGAHRIALGRLERLANAELGAGRPRSTAAIPRFADPLHWDGLVGDPDTVRYRMVGLLPALDPQRSSFRVFPRRFDRAEVRNVLDSCPGRVLMEFFRFPFATVEDGADGERRVVVRDARYARGRRDSFGSFAIPLKDDGTPDLESIRCPLD
jgi:inner membrane protein